MREAAFAERFLACDRGDGFASASARTRPRRRREPLRVRTRHAPPRAAPEVFKGHGCRRVVAQLRAAGVRTLFHTNTSGFVPFWEAIYAAGDVQVINMTHEGQAVARGGGLHDGKAAISGSSSAATSASRMR
jgi:hypothetical protein